MSDPKTPRERPDSRPAPLTRLTNDSRPPRRTSPSVGRSPWHRPRPRSLNAQVHRQTTDPRRLETRQYDVSRVAHLRLRPQTLLRIMYPSLLGSRGLIWVDMAVFDSLRFLSTYTKEAHLSGKQHCADLYEIVQYAGNIVPRLYLMITVGR
jgi:Vacuolar protein sorting-associated protein 35